MWTDTTLGQLCKMYQPKTISKKEMVTDGDYVVFGANGIIGAYNKYNHEEPQLLVSCRGTCGAVNVSEPFSWINGNAMVIQPDLGKVSLKYMEYLFRGGINLSTAITGTAQPQITRKSLEPIKISYPPLAEQERILAKLDAAFAEIDGTIEKAQAKVKEIKKFKDSILASMLNNNDWEDFKLAEICTKITDGSHNPPKGVTFSDFLMLSSKNVFDDAINFEKPRFLKEEDYIKENKRTDIQEGDVLLTIVGTIGRCAVVNDSLKPFTLQRSVAVLKPAHDLVLSRFLMYLLQDMLQILLQGARGVAQKGIYLKSLRELKLKVPPLSEQRSIITNLDAIYGQVDSFKDCISNNKENYKALKSAILDKELHQNEAT